MDAKIKNLKDAVSLRGTRVLLRLDLNVPVVKGKIKDDYKIKKSLGTLEYLQRNGARTIIVSHAEGKSSDTLKPMLEYLRQWHEVTFLEKYFIAESDQAVSNLKDGEIILLENLRIHGEEKANDEIFSKKLASLADIYVNEAFSASHRKHASIVGVPKFIPSYAGFLFLEEMRNLSKLFNPSHPFLFILGGVKFETKIPLIKKFIAIADDVFVGGAIGNNFYKEQGLDIGESAVSTGDFNIGELLASGKITLPNDAVVKNLGEVSEKLVGELSAKDSIVDSGPAGLKQVEELVKQAKFILWNGPLGNYEMGFTKGTLKLATIIAESKGYSIVGGADTLAAIFSLKLLNKFGFVSTAGGAMLDFLANGTLPGIKALQKNPAKVQPPMSEG